MQFQITCACAAAWVGMCRRRRGNEARAEIEECGDDGDSARQRAPEPMRLTLRGIITWSHQ